MSRWRCWTSCTFISADQRVSSRFETVSWALSGDGHRGADYASTVGNTDRADGVEALLRMPASG